MKLIFYLIFFTLFILNCYSDGYVVDVNGYLYEINVDSGVRKKIGKIEVPSKDGKSTFPQLTDLALAPDQKIYGVSFNALYIIDPRQPDLSELIGSFSFNVNAASFDNRGNLYVAGGNALYKANLKTAALSKVGITNYLWTSDGDLAFVRGKMYGTFTDYSEKGSVLAQIDLKTAKAEMISIICDTSGTPVKDVWGLFYYFENKQEKLCGLTRDGKAYLINITTGQVEKEFVTDLNVWGACHYLKF